MVHPPTPSYAITDRSFDWFLASVTRLRAIQVPGWFWVVLLWAVFAFPAVGLRGVHYEEGTVIGLARGAVEDGHWLAPHLYGVRFVERPVLLSWIAAAIGSLFGGVNAWSARIPHLLFLLAGGLMVFHLVRPLTRTAPAVFGALCWFACSMVGQKFITAEPDVTLSVLLFGGFLVWWRGIERGHVSLARWLAVGLLLGAAGLTKGPQPIAYFTLGVGAWLVLQRRWRDVPGFVLANVIAASMVGAWYVAVMQPGDLAGWQHHSRLAEHMSASQWWRDHLDFIVSIFVEWLPGSLLLGPAIVALWRREPLRDNGLLLAAVLYASVGSLILLVWPGGVATRYAMPANLALAVMAGILYDRWWSSRPWLIGAGNTVVIAISAYLVLLGWLAMPLFPDAFRQTRIAAQEIEAVRRLIPGTLHVSDVASNVNILASVAAPVRVMSLAQIGQLALPALALLTPADIAALAAQQPAVRLVPHLAIKDKSAAQVVEILPK
jgi:4-amino-4-deoxy-L-arabinose transferase-like glycosyltransferase